LVEGTQVIESNCIYFAILHAGIIFLTLRTSFRTLINYYAITSRPAPFSTQLPDNENIGGKGTFITCYSVKLRYCATWPYRNYFWYQQQCFYRVRHHNCRLYVITYLFYFVSSYIKICNINFNSLICKMWGSYKIL